MSSGINDALGVSSKTSAAASAVKTVDPWGRAADRYQDGYRVARFITTVGTVVKVFGVVAGVLVFAIGALGNSENILGRDTGELLVIVSVFMGVGVWFLFFVMGVIVSAQGQQLKASLDSAVHSSPFLDLEAKARAMNL